LGYSVYSVLSDLILKMELQEFEIRKMSRNDGRRYCDPAMLTYQAERMPEPIRHQVGGMNPARVTSVYGECGKTIPGFRPLTDREAFGPKVSFPFQTVIFIIRRPSSGWLIDKSCIIFSLRHYRDGGIGSPGQKLC